MKIHQIFFNNSLRNFSYLVDLGDHKWICIDPFEGKKLIDFITKENLGSISYIINTHDHCDHYSGNDLLVNSFMCPVLGHINAEIPFKNKGLLDGEIVHQVGSWSLRCLYTPGHTLTHIALVLEENGVPKGIFTGDCFFNAGVGNCHNGGDVSVHFETISKVFSNLPDEVLIYPGHEYLKKNLLFTKNYETSNFEATKMLDNLELVSEKENFLITSLSIEKKINLFLRLNSLSLREKLNIEEGEKDKVVFIKLRELRNQW